MNVSGIWLLTLHILITKIVVFLRFYQLIIMTKLQLLGMQCVFKNQYVQKLGFKLNQYKQFSPT